MLNIIIVIIIILIITKTHQHHHVLTNTTSSVSFRVLKDELYIGLFTSWPPMEFLT